MLTARACLGLAQAMSATTDAIAALQSHGTEGAPTLSSVHDSGKANTCMYFQGWHRPCSTPLLLLLRSKETLQVCLAMKCIGCSMWSYGEFIRYKTVRSELGDAVSTNTIAIATKADADDVNDLAENLAAGATDLAALQTQVTQAVGQLDTKAAADDLTALQTVVDTLPTADDVATKAEARDVTALQAQQTINSAAVTALESHGTEGAPVRMIARFSAQDAHRTCMFRTCSSSVGDY